MASTTTNTTTTTTPALLFEKESAAAAAAALAAAAGTSAVTAAGIVHVTNHVLVHPIVLLHILDHHSRRPEPAGRVIGTLLGQRVDAGTVELTHAFAVPHVEQGNDEVAIGKDYNKKMLALHYRGHGKLLGRCKDVVMGWYATSMGSDTANLIADTSSLIHEFYAGESEEGDPIHLVVDTRLKDNSLHIKAFKSTPVILQGEAVGNLFHEIQVSVVSTEPETICLQEMIAENVLGSSNYANEKDVSADLQVSMEKLYELLETVSNYVDGVVEAGDNKKNAALSDPATVLTGRHIADVLATVPRIRDDVMDRLFHDSLQDLLMVTYLSNITKTQLMIAEKLNANLGI